MRRTHGLRCTGAAITVAVAMTAVGCVGGAPPAGRPPSTDHPEPAPPADDPALVSRSIMPPGNGNISGFTTAHLDDQRAAYDRLEVAQATGTVTDESLPAYYKDARLDASAASVRTDTPTPGVSVRWDRWGVPTVHGDTAEQVAWGAGWVVAETRLLIAEAGRVLGRAGTIEMGGSDIIGALAQIGSLPQVNYTDAELEAALDRTVADHGPEGQRMLAAIDAFVDGINFWLDTNTFPQEVVDAGLHWRHWTRADVLAVGVVVDDIFGAGGGDEVGNATMLTALERRLGATAGRATFDDLRTAHDDRSTTHVNDRFDGPIMEAADGTRSPDTAVDPAAVAIPDSPIATPPVRDALMSNYVAVTGARSASGHPILVGGPQSSYFAPQLLLEMGLQGGGYDSRGVTFPGLGPWVVIGRGRSYAWTATAGGSDLSDARVERLCEPDGSPPSTTSRSYLFEGRCVAMTRPDTATMTAWRTVHGPVAGTGTVAGQPVAISRQRMSRFQTAAATTAFWALNRNGVASAASFAATMSAVPMSFNWLYVDAADVAYFHSGWYPIRAAGVDPDLPSWGTGEWEWRGRLDWSRQPQRVLNDGEVAVSWNNRVAPGWRESDNDWSSGEVQRVDLLATRAAELHDATPADVVRVAQDAATVDLRGAAVLGPVLDVLDSGPAPSAELASTVAALRRWQDAGAHRRDVEGDGWYDDPTVAVMDAWFPSLVEAVFAPTLGPAFDPPIRRPKTVDHAPSLTGSAYGYGWHGQLARDLHRVLGDRPTPPGVPIACGGGSLDRCRAVLWATLDAARRSTGGAPKLALLERIRFIPFLPNADSMRWVNRPTFQQVVGFG